MFSEGWTTDTVAAYMGPPALAVRMICSSEEPITTKTKNPSMTGPTEKPYLDFSLALMSTRPRLWMFLWNLAEEAAKTRLEAACARGGNRGRGRAGQLYERNERESRRRWRNTRCRIIPAPSPGSWDLGSRRAATATRASFDARSVGLVRACAP